MTSLMLAAMHGTLRAKAHKKLELLKILIHVVLLFIYMILAFIYCIYGFVMNFINNFLRLAVLENVVFDEHNREVDYIDKSMTDGTEHNLDEYIQIISSSSNLDDDSTAAVQSEKFGVVVNEDKLEGFFSMIYDDHY